MKYLQLFIISALLIASSIQTRGQVVEKYEFERDLPSFLDSIQSELIYPLAWGNCGIEDFDTWKATARAKLTELMLAPPPRPACHEMEVLAEEKRDGYTAKKIRFNLTRYSRVEAYLLIPDGEGRFPGIVALHDHGGHFTIGKEKMVRPFGVSSEVLADSDGWVDKLYGGQYVGDYLAKEGYAVISVDALFWGDRGRKEGADGSKLADVAGNFLMLGRNLSAWMTFEDVYVSEFLSSLPEVDSERIGCIGLSMGGYRAWMLAALSPLVKASVAVCWMTTTASQISWKYGRKERGGFANNLGGVRNYLDYPHIASLACPAAMMLINGESDKLFKPHSVRECYAIMRDVWESQNVGDKLETHLLPIGHELPVDVQTGCLDFLDRHLKQ